MKKRTMIFSTFLVSSLVGLTAIAETVVENIIDSRDWKAVIMDEHRATGQSACVASTTKGTDRLEVYAEKSSVNGFVSAVVVMSASADDPMLMGTVSFGGSRKYEMAYVKTDADSLYVAKVKDTSALVRELKRGNTATVSLKGKDNQSRTVRFSLRGSSRGISTAIDHCDL